MTDFPKVSVIIPTFNNAKYLVPALESVLAQDCTEFEIIVVDDGSTDHTSELVSGFRDQRIRYVRQENLGVSAARNRGIEEANGGYVAFLDSDDLWLPDNLSTKLAVLDANKAVGAVFSEFCVFDDDGTRFEDGSKALYPIFGRESIGFKDIFGAEQEVELRDAKTKYRSAHVFHKLFLGNFILTSTLVVRRSVLTSVGRFDSSFETNEDYEFFLRLARAAPIAYVGETLVRYRRHLGQLTSPENNVKVLEAVLRIVESQDKFLSDLGKAGEFEHRRSQVLTALGKACIGSGRVTEAREYLLQSIRVRQSKVENYLHFLVSFLPVQNVKWRRRRRGR